MRPPASRRRVRRGRSWRRLAQAAVMVAAGLVLATLPGLSPAPVQAKTSWELNEELSQSKERLEQARRSIQEAEAVRLVAEQDMAGLDQKIELLQEELTASTEVRDVAAAKLAQTRRALDEVSSELAKKRKQFDKAEADLSRANASLEARAVGIYKAGRMGYVLTLLENSNLSDLLTRVGLLTKIMNQDIQIAEEIRVLQGRVIEEGNELGAEARRGGGGGTAATHRDGGAGQRGGRAGAGRERSE